MNENLVGQMVLYTLIEGTAAGEQRPAVIVRDWGEGSEELEHRTVNLQVFTDSAPPIPGRRHQDTNDGLPPVMWVTSAQYSPNGDIGTWMPLPQNGIVLPNPRYTGE